MTPLLVGVDVGTSTTKGVVVTSDGRERSRASVPTPWTMVPGGAEAHPDALVSAALTAVTRALDEAPPGRVVGLGVASMAETGVLLDGDERPLHPAIAWHDKRGGEDAELLAAELGAGEVTRRTGLALSSKLSAVKCHWLVRSGTDMARARRWLGVAEWVVYALGGSAVAEPSLAARTGWLDLDRGEWWPEALAWSGVNAALLPELHAAGSRVGTAHSHLPRLAGAALTVAGHDHQAAAVGAGALDLDDVLDSCGTAEAFVRSVRGPVDSPMRLRAVEGGLSVSRHVLPDRMAVIAGLRTGARLRAVREALGLDAETADAAAPRPAPELRAGDLDRIVADPGYRPAPAAELWRSALATAAREGAAVLTRLTALTGPYARLVLVGGLSRSAAFTAAKRALHDGVFQPAVLEPGGRGAALFAGVAAGVYADVLVAPHPQAPVGAFGDATP